MSPPSFDEGRLRATPAARLRAAAHSVALSELTGSGPAGAVLLVDVDAHLSELEAQAPDADGVRETDVLCKCYQRDDLREYNRRDRWQEQNRPERKHKERQSADDTGHMVLQPNVRQLPVL